MFPLVQLGIEAQREEGAAQESPRQSQKAVEVHWHCGLIPAPASRSRFLELCSPVTSDI